MPRGHLVIRVKEASGKNKSDTVVWDPNFIEGFVRAELRTKDGKKTNVQSTPKRVLANQISWDEELRLEVNDQSKELRLMLCREKRTGTRVGVSVIAACGIFVEDILDAVPIDKFFELFKPGAAGEGGFIRIGIDFEDHTRRRTQANGAPPLPPKPTEQRPQEFYTQVSIDATDDAAGRGGAHPTSEDPQSKQQSSRRKGAGLIKATMVLAAIGGALFFVQKKRTEVVETKERKSIFKRK